jgi:hypothetical protein
MFQKLVLAKKFPCMNDGDFSFKKIDTPGRANPILGYIFNFFSTNSGHLDCDESYSLAYVDGADRIFLKVASW